MKGKKKKPSESPQCVYNIFKNCFKMNNIFKGKYHSSFYNLIRLRQKLNGAFGFKS